MRQYNVAIVGYGWVSGAHIAAINASKQARVTAVYSSRPLDAAELSRRHGSPLTCFDDLGRMLARDDIHVVSICSYPHQHAEQLIATVNAGKHFIIEKPITLTLDEARAVAKAVNAAGVKGCVCFEGRFSGQFLATKSLIDQGFLGTIHYAEVDYYHGIGPWYGQYRWNTLKSSGGSSLLSAGCHALSSMLLCMGNEVESITTVTTRSQSVHFSNYEYPTTSVSILRFSGGRLGKVASVIDCLQPYYRHIHLVGSEGSLLDDKFHSQRIKGLDSHRWSVLGTNKLDSGNVHDHPYLTQFEAFFSALTRNEDMPLTSFNEGMLTHRLALAADLSAEIGKPLTFDDVAV